MTDINIRARINGGAGESDLELVMIGNLKMLVDDDDIGRRVSGADRFHRAVPRDLIVRV